MKNKFDLTLLRFLCEALQKPVPKREYGLYPSVLRNVAREGWVSFADIEDIICETDPRLYRMSTIDIAAALEIPIRSLFPRPKASEKTVWGYAGFEPADAAALLIWLRRFGFSVDPQPLVDLILPDIRKRTTLNESELSVFWFRKERDRFGGFTVQADTDRPQSLRTINLVSETGYQVEICLNQEDDPWLLSVGAPKRSWKRSIETA